MNDDNGVPPEPLVPEPVEEPGTDANTRYEPPMPRWLGYVICGAICLAVGALSTLSFKIGDVDAKTLGSEKIMADARDAATVCSERLQELDTQLQLRLPGPSPTTTPKSGVHKKLGSQAD